MMKNNMANDNSAGWMDGYFALLLLKRSEGGGSAAECMAI
jgi:hypothetical protein